ncbi:MAG: hypothetical protein HOO96_03630 [Polyangiaceae bacterium]|nr:hypothetical protein [Polyangiaceae bacterium]
MTIPFSYPVIALAGLIALSSAGCSLDTGEAGGDDADVVTEKAKVSTQTIDRVDGRCNVGVTFLVVEARSPSASGAINAKLTRTYDQIVEGVQCETTEFAAKSEMLVAQNGKGLLSLSEVGVASRTGQVVIEVATWTFDLRNGKQLSLGDVLTSSGMEVLKTTCVSAYTAVGATPDCDVDASAAKFVIEAKGIRSLQPDAGVQLGLEGQLVPWNALKGKIKHPLVKALVP